MKLCDKEFCSGCLACYNACNHNAIKLIKDEEGFTYPLIEKTRCKECGLCIKSCPVVSPFDHEKLESIEVYAAWNKDYEIVRKSSSGGVFTTVSRWIFSKNGVVYGAAFDEQFNLNHIRVDKEIELFKLIGSKYLQSNIGDTFRYVKEDLRNNLWVLYVGTPCQIAGLNNYLGNKIDNSRLVTIDLVCHGVPSPLMFQEYKNYLESKFNSKLKSYSFRDKKWSWLHYNIKAEFENEKIYYGKWEEDIFKRGFLRNLYLRPSCHQCLYANTNRIGDFSIADFWCYSGEKHEEKNRDRGVSVVMVNTSKAKNIYSQIEDCLYSYSKPLSQPVKTNRSLKECFPASSKRNQFWEDYRNYGYEYLIDKYFYPEKIGITLKILYLLGPKFSHMVSSLISLFSKSLKLFK